MAEPGKAPQAHAGRYKTLLEISSAIAHDSNLQAVLKSLHRLLSAVVPFDSVVVLLLAEDGKSIRVTALGAASTGGGIELGTELPYAGTPVEPAIKDQQPVYIPDMPSELLKIDALAPCVILTQGDELIVPLDDLMRSAPSRTTPVLTFHDAERQAIIDALKACSGKLAGSGGAAERLGLKRTTLQNKMRKLNISRADYSE